MDHNWVGYNLYLYSNVPCSFLQAYVHFLLPRAQEYYLLQAEGHIGLFSVRNKTCKMSWKWTNASLVQLCALFALPIAASGTRIFSSLFKIKHAKCVCSNFPYSLVQVCALLAASSPRIAFAPGGGSYRHLSIHNKTCKMSWKHKNKSKGMVGIYLPSPPILWPGEGDQGCNFLKAKCKVVFSSKCNPCLGNFPKRAIILRVKSSIHVVGVCSTWVENRTHDL